MLPCMYKVDKKTYEIVPAFNEIIIFFLHLRRAGFKCIKLP